jgi:hypothetical protein
MREFEAYAEASVSEKCTDTFEVLAAGDHQQEFVGPQ